MNDGRGEHGGSLRLEHSSCTGWLMSVHARPSAMLRLGVRLSCVAGGIVGVGLAVVLLFRFGAGPALFALLVCTPILIGLAGAIATLIVSPLRVRERQQHIAARAGQREKLGHAVLITDGTARYYHPVPQPDVPVGAGAVTAYSSGYIGFQDAMRVEFRTRQLEGWWQVSPGEFLLCCLPLYDISVRTKDAAEWREWLTEFYGPHVAPAVIDLVAAEGPPRLVIPAPATAPAERETAEG